MPDFLPCDVGRGGNIYKSRITRRSLAAVALRLSTIPAPRARYLSSLSSSFFSSSSPARLRLLVPPFLAPSKRGQVVMNCVRTRPAAVTSQPVNALSGKIQSSKQAENVRIDLRRSIVSMILIRVAASWYCSNSLTHHISQFDMIILIG